MAPTDVTAVLNRLGVTYVLIGGRAVVARGYVRSTLDVDYLTMDRRVLDRQVWSDLIAAGAHVDARAGEFDDPLGGVVHIQLPGGRDVDVVVGKHRWQQFVIERAEVLEIDGEQIAVPLTGDLIVLKLAAGGYQDRADAHALLSTGREGIIRQVESHLDELPAELREAWQRFLAGS
jgi:predicted nucleotidyltransferase